MSDETKMNNDITPGILAGRTALVTGSSGGIGAQIALSLAREGANVALHYHHNKPVKTIEMIQEHGGNYCVVQADLGENNFEVELLGKVENHLATPDILINCAASQDVGNLQEMSVSEFDEMMNINVSAVFALSTEFARRLSDKHRHNASIINISSIEATRPALGHGHYATSKATLEMLTRSMAQEFGPTGLRVNAIAPGLIAREGIKEQWPDGVERWENACPLGRMGTPDDIARAVLFLASPAAAFINGSVLTIDGGMSTMPGW